jgi:hypothetical protein
MLVLTLVLAAAGFALLVVALITGSVIWAWGCIAVCVVGAGVLLAGALIRRTGRVDVGAAPAGDVATETPDPAPVEQAQPQERRGRHEKPDFG